MSETEADAIQRLCAEGDEAADFLRTFVVQARLNERGNYGMLLHANWIEAEP